LIEMGDHMALMQISTETSTWLQARDFLVEARRLKPCPTRNKLRETARVLRELAEREAQAESAALLDRAEKA
jgi:hypothetical protein